MTASEKFMVMVGDDFFSPFLGGTVTLTDDKGIEELYLNGTRVATYITEELLDTLLEDWMKDNGLNPAQVERLLHSPYIGRDGMYN